MLGFPHKFIFHGFSESYGLSGLESWNYRINILLTLQSPQAFKYFPLQYMINSAPFNVGHILSPSHLATQPAF